MRYRVSRIPPSRTCLIQPHFALGRSGTCRCHLERRVDLSRILQAQRAFAIRVKYACKTPKDKSFALRDNQAKPSEAEPSKCAPAGRLWNSHIRRRYAFLLLLCSIAGDVLKSWHIMRSWPRTLHASAEHTLRQRHFSVKQRTAPLRMHYIHRIFRCEEMESAAPSVRKDACRTIYATSYRKASARSAVSARIDGIKIVRDALHQIPQSTAAICSYLQASNTGLLAQHAM